MMPINQAGNCINSSGSSRQIGAISLCILVTVYNRWGITKRGLSSLLQALSSSGIGSFEIHLVDDASPDRTGAHIAETYPFINLYSGTGGLYWNGGMRLAHRGGRKSQAFDTYLIFNDDVITNSPAFGRMVAEYLMLNSERPTIVAGAILDPDTNTVMYSGYRKKSKWNPLRIEKVLPSDAPVPCDTFNGNLVLIPRAVLDGIGGFDPHYVHKYGDIDIGYRAAAAGARIAIASGVIGETLDNHKSNPSIKKVGIFSGWDRQDSLGQRWYFLRSHAGLVPAVTLILPSIIRQLTDIIQRRLL